MTHESQSKRAVLNQLVDRHDLQAEDLARLTRASVHTVRAWLKPNTSKSHREIPDGLLELLCLKLGEPSPFDD